MKRIFTQTLAVLAMAAFSSTAMAGSVVINPTNFPDDNLREYLLDFDWDGNGILEGDEYDSLGEPWITDVTNFKGLELLSSIWFLHIGYSSPDENPLATVVKTIDLSMLPDVEYLYVYGNYGLETLDISHNTKLISLYISDCPVLKDIKWSSSLWRMDLTDLQSLSTINGNDLPNLAELNVTSSVVESSVSNINFAGHQSITHIEINGNEDFTQNVNTFHVENCPNLDNILVSYATVPDFTMKNLSSFRFFSIRNTTAENIDIQECPMLESVVCEENELGTLQLSNNPKLWQVQCNDNKLRSFIVDNCPNLYDVYAFNNQLMWLDMTDVVRDGSLVAQFRVDNQNPTVQAVKISPTEVGLRVHDRLDVSRVLNLKAKGQAMEPKEIFVDGIRYFVIYNNGPEVESLVGAAGTEYEYQTKWPYPFHAAEGYYEGDSKDDNLPVTLNVTNWTKHPAFIKLSQNTVKGVYGEPAPQAPAVTRSQDYDGKLTWKSSNENVVKVNPETGELTVVGAGTATITVSGAETDYRLAPSSISYSVVIEKATPEFAFEQAEIESADGFVPQNKLSIGLYDGTVVYTSSDEEIATVDADGKVTAKQAGSVTITATGAETANCKEASAQYVLNILSTDGIKGIQAEDGEAVIYNLSGQRVNGNAKGIQIRNGKKVLVK